MERLINAFRNSVRAFGNLLRTETAFQQEMVLLLIAVPVAWFVADDWWTYLLLVGSVLILIMVEVLNTGIEAACDAFSREFNVDIQLAKDCGSLAVLISIFLAGCVWALAVWEKIAGIPV